MKHLLGITHSDRTFDLQRCSLNFLQQRYRDPARLAAVPPFVTLDDAQRHQPYDGEATFWIFDDAEPTTLRRVTRFDPDYKVQHAVFIDGLFAMAGPTFVELVDPQGHSFGRISDPWMAGVHTCFGGRGTLAVACSASDAILLVDVAARRVTNAFRLPEARYGRNYDLARTDDVRAHYVTNDLQLTHVNAAWPAPEGIYVSTLIHGAIGRFSWDGGYEEIVRGYWGAHGVRRIDERTLLFADSCLGCACLLDLPSGRVRSRIDFDSRWLHDVETTDGRHFFGAVGDRNVLALYDGQAGRVVAEWPMSEFGAGVQFLSAFALPPAGLPWLDESACPALDAGHAVGQALTERTVIDLEVRTLRRERGDCVRLPDGSVRVVTGAESGYYAAASTPCEVDPGEYEGFGLLVDASLERGAFSVGILDIERDAFRASWIVSAAGRHKDVFYIHRDEMPPRFRIVFANHRPEREPSVFTLHELAIRGRSVK